MDLEFIYSSVVSEICELTHDMWQKGWDEYNGGNVSYLLDEAELYDLPTCHNVREEKIETVPQVLIGRYIIITASGSHFRTLKNHIKRDLGVIRITASGYEVIWGFEGGKRPTSELYMHLLAHSQRLGVDPHHRVVVHNHAPNITAYSLVVPPNDKAYTLPLWRVLTESIVVFPDGVGVLPWELPGTLTIAQHSVAKLTECRIVVWAFHGVLATGKDCQDCFGLIETVDKAAKIYLQTLNCKQYDGLSDENLYAVCQVLNVKPRTGFLKVNIE